MKNKLTIALGIGALLWSTGASADRTYRSQSYRAPAYSQSAERYRTVRTTARTEYDFARVLDVEPIVRYVTVNVPRRECWDENVVVERRRRTNGAGNGSAGATIAGGLLGGVIGRQVGGGSGRDAMTVVGAILGSAIGNQSTRTNRDDRDDARYDTVQRCETVSEAREEERIDGYHVTYLYNGREYTTRTRNHPGERIRVRVTVNPTTRR
ncbi:MAG: glycine zipper 2TM domain-containing protein [Gammaproteobacteria bacterium]